jgi:hypothetical protein
MVTQKKMTPHMLQEVRDICPYREMRRKGSVLGFVWTALLNAPLALIVYSFLS